MEVMMLDAIGMAVLTSMAVLNIGAIGAALHLRWPGRLIFIGAGGLWIGLQTAFASSGVLLHDPFGRIPAVGLMLVTMLAVMALFLFTMPRFRAALMEVPPPLLIGLNIGRIFGAFFLFLAVEGRLNGPFPYSAGWGDVITGVLALPVALHVARSGGRASPLARAWNVFGALDLIAAVALGVMSANGSPIQVFQAAPGASPMQMLPWSLIPTVLVPFYLIMHAVLFVQLQRPAGARDNARGLLANPV
jgi:hypothetical protein